MKTKIMKVGIISKEDYRKSTIAMAIRRLHDKQNEPKAWFESISSMAQVLNSETQALLKKFIHNKLRSLTDLKKITSRNNKTFQEH